MNAAGEELLRVERLRYCYGPRVAVDEASFAIRGGEIFGLLGPNGAGKTTTIACLAGVLDQWSGEMRFLGQTFRPGRAAADRRRLGVVPQELALYDDLTARENLCFFGRLNGLQGPRLREAVAQALALAGLEPRADERVRNYSGGMKRRLNLAAGELHHPELLLLDEPTVGVDPQSRNHIFDTLLAMRAAGRTLLYTTHYMEEAERLCDRIAVMHQGRIVAAGSRHELAAQVGQPGANLEAVFLHLTGRSLRDV